MLAAIDLGSNSFRVITFDENTLSQIGDFEKVVGTAEGVSISGKISTEAVDRIIEAINLSIKKLDYEPATAIAVTTAAMRYAANSDEVIETIKDKTGVTFSIISGDEEARLTLLAIEYALKREKIDSSKFIAVDIGGGSTELIIKKDDNVISKSFEFGIVTLANSSKDLDEAKLILDSKIDAVKKFLSCLELDDLSNYTFVSTAGTPTTIAALKIGMNYFNYDKKQINGSIVSLDDIKLQKEKISNLNEDEVHQILGARKKRFVEVGILIYETIFNLLNKSESIVFDDGLREGVMIDYCTNN